MAMDAKSRLRGSFADVLQRQVGELAQLASDAVRDPDTRDALRFELERIRGTATTLNLDPVVRAAQTAMDSTEGGHLIPAIEHLIDVCRALEGLEAAFRPVVMMMEEPPEADEHAAVLRTANTLEEVVTLIHTEDPCAVVVPASEVASLPRQLEGRARTIPIYAVGPRYDLSLRLKASSNGAAGYLAEPLDMVRILERVRSRSAASDPPPYRMIMVEPDDEAAKRGLDALRGPDRVVHRVKTSKDLLIELDGFAPELVILATEVGSQSGLELGELIRGHELYGDVPVLFLATPDDVESTGFIIAADDILVKPVPPAILRGRAMARLQRFRRGERQRHMDRLTGCLSRSALLRAADREVGLARRTGNPLSVLLVDIDGMHALNERGLHQGDRALRAIADALRKNLRETDIVGRIGGDSFGVLLPKCASNDARKRLENVRRKHQLWCETHGLEVEFSAGVADTKAGFRDVLARADRALMEARHAGGSRSTIGK